MSGYAIENLLLMDSSFSRETEMELDPAKLQNTVNVDVQSSKPDGKLLVIMTVKFDQMFADKIQATASVTMIGVFQKTGDSELSEETFVNINAPAIIYPFVREHIASLFLKAGCGSVLLPPFNFAAKRNG